MEHRTKSTLARRTATALAVPFVLSALVVGTAAGTVADDTAARRAAESTRAELAGMPVNPDAREGRAAGEPATTETTTDTRVRPVAVKVVADRSYRNRFPHWRQKVKKMVERADNRLADVYGIDLTVTSTGRWRIGDPGGCGAWQKKLQNVNRSGADFVIGITRNGFKNAGGCTYRFGRYIAMQRQDNKADWIVTRHEVSHLYGAHDRYIRTLGDNPYHRDDLMEDGYDHPHWWSNEPGDGDRQIIRRHAERFN